MLPSNHTLACHKCGHALVPFDWMCFLEHNKAKHCTLNFDHQIKYNVNIINDSGSYEFNLDRNDVKNQNLLVSMKIDEPKNNKTLHMLHCRGCDEKVATVIKIIDEYKEENGKISQIREGFVCFRPEATFVKGLEDSSATKCRKWLERKLTFPVYDIKSYFPQLQSVSNTQAKEETHIVTTFLPNLNDDNLEKYYPSKLLHSIPRDYQVEMYFQSLFNNSLICLPTGVGKTLVSVLLIKKMCDLNPDKLVAFVVNKIPLAFQQCDYYSRETGYSSIVLCSQTRDAKSIERLLNREVQVCFFTGGLLLNLLENATLRPEDFSMVVFDEIHHGVSDKSNYSLLASKFRNSKTEVKITGLTATPLDFEQLRLTFNIDFVSYPTLTREDMENLVSTTDTKIKKTLIKVEQTEMISKIKEEIIGLNEKLLEFKINNLWNFGSFKSIIGYLRNYIPQEYEPIAKKMLIFIGALEVADILGTKEAKEFIKSSVDIKDSYENFSTIIGSFSERFGFLESVLNKTQDDSRILVFVKTKEMAFRLTRMLERKFKRFYPKRIVGQHGAGGMNYENEQKLLIEEFKNRECKLLVSTSVLEEGIDISDCNMVILFDGNLSLRRIIQARGRARQKNSTFYMLIGAEEENYYKELEKKEQEMIESISLKSKESAKNIKFLLDRYLENRKASEPAKIKLLSFTVYHFESITTDDIRNTMEGLERIFELIEWDKQSIHIEMNLEEDQFEEIRKSVFKTILIKHAGAFIEPTETLHTHNTNNLCECTPGSMNFSERGFEFLKASGNCNNINELTFHNQILRAVGRYILIDEETGQYIFNVVNGNLNKFSFIGNMDTGSISIPEIFKDFKIYFIKLISPLGMIEVESMVHSNNDITYYLSYIQDRSPMLYISPQILSSISQILESLTQNDSFSNNALSLSTFVVGLCNLFKKCIFFHESLVLEYIKKLPKYPQSEVNSGINFIRCITHKEILDKSVIVELPQLVDDKRFFRKLHPDKFIKVKIVNQVPSCILFCGRNYLPIGGSLSMLRSNYVYFFDKALFSTVDEIMGIFGKYDLKLNPFKLVSRYALNFTTTTETCTIEKWKVIQEEYALDGTISFKGVLTVLPDTDLHGMDVIVRESMHKFEGNEEFNKIEVVSYTTPRHPTYLNKQIILLLLSLGISQDNFLSLFLEYFRNLASSISSPRYFLQILQENCMDTLPALKSLDEMPDDEFLQYLAKQLVYESIKKIQTKAMIPIEKAIIAMAIVDEYKQLKENEVMIQLGNGKYLEDGTKVFICRNPCLHPSDIQIFTARDNSLLRSKFKPHYPAVIFPCQGSTSIKLCDFDGDRVFACWDSRLIPNHVSNLSSISQDKKSFENTTVYNDILTKILDNGSTLGKISDGWLAITDSESVAAKHALELADLFVSAVDFPKTGEQISLPDWFKDIRYPDFMERKGSSITSNSILGRIYQKCTSIKSGIPSDFEEPSISIEDEKVKIWNDRFWQIVSYLKKVHSVTLFDLFVGEGIARKEFLKLIEQFREIVRVEKWSLRCIHQLPVSNIFSLTIPSRKIERFKRLDINQTLAKSLHNYVEKINLNQLEIMEQRLGILEEKTKLTIHIFGSLPVLLHNNMKSDCDTFINFTAEKGDESPPTICSVLSTEFGSTAVDWQKSIPMFRIFAKVTDLPFIESIDFTNSSRGLRKKHHLRLYLKQQPKLLVILKLLIDNIRKICPQVKTYQLTWKIIAFCIKENYLLQENPPTENQAFEGEVEKDSVFMKKVLVACLKSEFQYETTLMIKFLETLKFEQDMKFIDNLDGKVVTYTLTSEQVTHSNDLLDSCLLNIYLLHDFNKLNILEKEETQVYLPNLLSKVIGEPMLETILKRELENSCNCTITNFIKMNNDNYIINATGECGISTKLKQKLAVWNANCTYFRAKNQRLFLEGSNLTIFEGDSFDSPIHFIPYNGKCNPKHVPESITKHQPKLQAVKDFAELPIYEFYLKLLSQLQQIPAIDSEAKHFAYSIKFGTYYLINFEKSIFSEVTPLDSNHYNTLMKKNHFKRTQDVIQKEKKKETNLAECEKKTLVKASTPIDNSSKGKKQKKQKQKKAPSDSFLTFVDQVSIDTILKLLEGQSKKFFTEYHVYIIENMYQKNAFEYKVKLDENLKFKGDILSHHTRVMATTFIGKISDMRFYINHSQFTSENHNITKLVKTLDSDQWIIKIESPQQLTFNSKLPLVNVVRKLEKQVYSLEIEGEAIEITILKVSLFTKTLSSLDQNLDLTSEHYELKIALPKSNLPYSPKSCMTLLMCGIKYWEIIKQAHQQ